MTSPTLRTLHRYFDRDALFGIPKYGIFWLVVAVWILASLAEKPSTGIAFSCFACFFAGNKLAECWQQLGDNPLKTVVPGFSSIQSRAFWIWLCVFSIFLLGLLVFHGSDPVPAITLAVFMLWISAWIKLRFPSPSSLPAGLLALVVALPFLGLAFGFPKGIEAVIRHGGYWVAPLLACDSLLIIDVVWQTLQPHTVSARRVESEFKERLQLFLGWRLGERFSSLPLPPGYFGLPAFILIALVATSLISIESYVNPRIIDLSPPWAAVIWWLSLTGLWGTMGTLRNFGLARSTWPRLWLVTLSRKGFARWIVGGLIRELAITWVNLSVVFVIAAATLLRGLPAIVYGAVLAFMAVFMLSAAAFALVHTILRYRRSALANGAAQLAFSLVTFIASFLSAVLVSMQASWQLAFFSGYLMATGIAILTLALALRGLARADIQ